MSAISIPQYTLIGSAFAVSWVVVDSLANLLLMKHQKGCRLRFIGARWLRRKKAIEVAFLQFLIAFIASFFIQDFFVKLFSQAFEYIIPFVFSTFGILYLYILSTLPYQITPKRCLPSIILFVVAGLLFYGIFRLT